MSLSRRTPSLIEVLGRQTRTAILGGLALCLAPIALAQGAAAQAAPDSVSGVVALALSEAAQAHAGNDPDRLESALAVIERAGAHPIAEWSGEDPVPLWRTVAPTTSAPAPIYRGSPLGPGYRSGQVTGGKAEQFEQVFLSGEKARIALSSPGKAPLSLRVLDRNARAVCEGNNGACQWVPLFTQRYVIEIRNQGKDLARYFLVVE
ncbi:hypothetical protein [Novosphingobium mangrovi (ex Hu et al. 2023)]|uniref:Uncharacterized protein n=1 Tax=Novosphingobium mangrovi (ex Hu et al. 2023) TaxID=2930094 RepID=A0ABT0ADP7_9SPHN|nr:hypothetical protein [Novosphingobium mangrovi (ex Hu et al. 2023)]MCJ1961294.1 hypothetical protein [Novosphingobium mangrovi (ex Hu et al. 2023)]